MGSGVEEGGRPAIVRNCSVTASGIYLRVDVRVSLSVVRMESSACE